MSTGLSRFFMEASKDIPGWTEKHDTALVSLMNEHDAVFWRGVGWGFSTGYRKGVVLVSISPEDLPGPLKSRVVLVNRGTEFVTVCKSRVAGETPRKKSMALVDELPDAKYITAVLYHKDVLAEDNDRTTECDWEVVMILCQVDKEEPMAVGTLLANHFKLPGGTATNMSNDEFVQTLGRSVRYWSNKALGIGKAEWTQYLTDRASQLMTEAAARGERVELMGR